MIECSSFAELASLSELPTDSPAARTLRPGSRAERTGKWAYRRCKAVLLGARLATVVLAFLGMSWAWSRAQNQLASNTGPRQNLAVRQAGKGMLPKLPDHGLAIAPPGRGGRTPVSVDLLEAMRVDGGPIIAKEGQETKFPDGSTQKWQKVSVNKDGAFESPILRGGYLRLDVESAADRVMMLELGGHSFLAVNGEPHTGDPYGNGIVRVPILLKDGKNEILIQGGRAPSLKPVLAAPPADVFILPGDETTPDLISGPPRKHWAGVRVVNATTNTVKGLRWKAMLPGGGTLETPIRDLPPLSLTKAAVEFEAPANLQGDQKLELTLIGQDGKLISADPHRVTLNVRKPGEHHKRTFVSSIDGGVQYYSVVPAKEGDKEPGLTLTLHGAGVEANGQAACYQSKPWTHVVAATNRRPFGFDWEDWGRLDALEVLHDAEGYLKSNPRRRWLTGHSMGGHGTWHLGVTFPDKFGAIGPSAGWISMYTYAGMRRPENLDPISAMILRAAQPSDTFALAGNLKSIGVYVLHGDKDDNVPVQQARMMKGVLDKFHKNMKYHEQPGAGHWWGNDCVDWKPMFDFFSSHSIPTRSEVTHVEFTTANPGVSAECHWARIDAQVKAMEISSITLDFDAQSRRFTGTTKNVARLALDVGHLEAGKPIAIDIDGQKLDAVAWPAEGPTLWLESEKGKWKAAAKPSPGHKGPLRNGGFKDVFRNRVLLVYGTRGTFLETSWALAKARYDAEQFWYRGNGSFEVIPDTAFDPDKDTDRNVVLYGHSEMNGAWKALLGESPIRVKRDVVSVDGKVVRGTDLGCLFVQPRRGSSIATVGVIAGTGMKGLRSTNRLNYFVSGTGFPDLMILGPDALTKGTQGILAAGFFGNDWSVEKGDIAWREEK